MSINLELLEEQAAAAFRNGNGPILDDIKPGAKVFRLMGLEELFRRPDKKWLWEGLIGAGDVAMIFGESGTAKTFSTVDLIVSGAAGLPFARKFKPARRLKMAYCAGEGIEGLKGRFQAAMNKFGLKPGDVSVAVSEIVPQLFDDASLEYVSQFVVDMSDADLDVIFIDTLHSATAGADENGARDAGVILRNVKYISKSLGVTVILIHHANKAGGYRGSSALHGAMDTMIQTRQEGEMFTLECFKQKDAERFSKLFFRLVADEYVPSARVEWLEAETIDLNRDNRAADKAEAEVTRILSDAGEALNQSEIVRRSTVGRTNVLAALGTLERSGAVKTVESGRAKLYQLSAVIV